MTMGLPKINMQLLILDANILILFATFNSVFLEDYTKAGVLVSVFLLANWFIAWFEENNERYINLLDDLESASVQTVVKVASSSHTNMNYCNNKINVFVETFTTIIMEEEKPFKHSMLMNIFAKYYSSATILATALIPLLLSTNRKHWIYSSLVISPCAQVISSTMAATCAKDLAARLGLVIQGGTGCLKALAKLDIQLCELSSNKSEIIVTSEDHNIGSNANSVCHSLVPDDVVKLSTAAWIGREYTTAVAQNNLFLLIMKMLITVFVVAGYIPAFGAMVLIVDLGACMVVILKGISALLSIQESFPVGRTPKASEIVLLSS
ncbi:hypothetical protein SELMODRAFT_417746 [Selaginella moellendorffii]|uniref:Uncharacterized protein n=1 Tax=Selaginella moellendorffii TaxID=88036 RepID=D8S3H3_SELML|nr:hypothetical protein SELMODRAFT_417746 [Selaginella moellendorffii]